MSELKPYPAYKDSGIEWLGEVPEEWQVKPSFAFSRLKKRAPREQDGIVTAFRDGEVTLRSKRRTDGFTEALQEFGYQGVRQGDLVIHSMDGFAGAIGVSDSDGKMSPVVHIYELNGVDAGLIANQLRVAAKSGYIESLAKGIRERSTSFDRATFKGMRFPVPPLSEQRAIADFLDRETAAIDAFVQTSEQLIDLLNERRSAVITQAVTKGLDPSAPMKDSGIEWLGEVSVPAHWPRRRVGHLLKLPSGTFIPGEEILEEGDFEVYGGGASRGFTTHWNVEPSTLIIGRVGAHCGKVQQVKNRAFVTDNALIALLTEPISNEWLAYMFESMDLGQYRANTAQPLLTAEAVRLKHLPLPPLPEQQAIADHLDHETAQIDEAIAETRKAIDLAKERRQALISAAVTGKFDVRETV